MSEAEFWKSTLAKVDMLYQVKRLDWDKGRDYLVACLVAFKANQLIKRKPGEPLDTPHKILDHVYPKSKKKQSVIVTHDPDHGASGDWKGMKSGMKGITRKAKERKAKLKPFIKE